MNSYADKNALLNRVVAELSDRLKTPSDVIPNVQWLSKGSLLKLLIYIRNSVNGPKRLTGTELVKHLIDSKLAQQLNLDDFSDYQKPPIIYYLDLGNVDPITPIELLQVSRPASTYMRTVMCYFTALSHHELTTQEAPYYHVASLRESTTRTQQTTVTHAPTHENPTAKEPTLGTLLFRYQSIPYYETQRDTALIPGIQTVHLSATCMVRMTTLEQTLLDTLHKPWSCGGPSVIFEAWERGLPLLDDARLAHCLKMIGRIDFTRRAGYMLEYFGHITTNNNLEALLSDAKNQVKSGNFPPIPLLPDVPTTIHNSTWGVTT